MIKKLIIPVLALLSVCAQAQVNEKPFVVPELSTWTGATGSIQPNGRIVVKDKQLRSVAEQLKTDYNQLLHTPATLTSGKARQGDIVLICNAADNTLTPEGYRLRIGNTIEIEASTATGAYWGTQTLLQLLEQGPLPKGETVDIPQYRLRGFMLDVGRKYIPIHYLRSLVRIMAYYKMNTLQLHLNDNGFRQYFENDWAKTPAAFRLECETYPGLTATDGSYTKAEFIELQKLAEALHVEIIPEIDAPAHVLAFTHYRPELGSQEYGMDHFDLGNPDVYDFMDKLFDEYLSGKEPVFRGPRVNIGTDEYSNRDQRVVEEFRAFTDHYLSLVKSYGKHPSLWGALTHAQGTTPVQTDDALMMCWHNPYAQPDSMMNLGYRIVSIPDGLVYIVPAAGYYYDYLNCKHLYDNWTPAVVANKTFPEQHPQIEGGMFALWNDHYGNGISTKDVHHRVVPALQTLSVKCWTGRQTTLPFEDFNRKKQALSEAPGVNELGRIPEAGCQLPTIEAGQALGLPLADAGYDYAVSFDIDCRPEERGTVFTQSAYATFYLSSPEDGRLAFMRDGYLNAFNYALPKSGKVNIRIEGTNKETRLFVNNRRQQVLSTKEVYVVNPDNRLHTLVDAPFEPTVYSTGAKMYYVPTLFFPLEKAGDFKSRVTNLNVRQL